MKTNFKQLILITMMLTLSTASFAEEGGHVGGGGRWLYSYFSGLIKMAMFTADDSIRIQKIVDPSILVKMQEKMKFVTILPTINKLCLDNDTGDCEDLEQLVAKSYISTGVIKINIPLFMDLDFRSQMQTALHEAFTQINEERNSDIYSRTIADYARLDRHKVTKTESGSLAGRNATMNFKGVTYGIAYDQVYNEDANFLANRLCQYNGYSGGALNKQYGSVGDDYTGNGARLFKKMATFTTFGQPIPLEGSPQTGSQQYGSLARYFLVAVDCYSYSISDASN